MGNLYFFVLGFVFSAFSLRHTYLLCNEKVVINGKAAEELLRPLLFIVWYCTETFRISLKWGIWG